MNLPDEFLARPLAHRGLHDRDKGIVENSRDAFTAAIEAGYGIECDVQLSADGHAMVFHDYSMARLTGERGPIQMMDSATLKEIRLTDSENQIETLPEMLQQVSGKVPLLIELKDQDGAMGSNIGRLEQRVADALRSYTGSVAVMSFNPNSTIRMAELLPNIPRGIVTSAYDATIWPLSSKVCDRLREISDFGPSGSSFISHEASDLGRARVAQLKSGGARILCWTITSQKEADQALAVADNITFEGFLPA